MTVPRLHPVALMMLLFPVLCGLSGCKKGEEIVIPPPGPPWITFKLPGTGQLLANDINALHADQSGRVWIASDSGVNSYLRGSWGRFRDSVRFSSDGVTFRYAVNTVVSGKFSTIWFGLDGGGVRRFREGASRSVWTTYNSELVFTTIQSISADLVVNGDVWVATTNGVSRYIPSANDPEFGSWLSYRWPNLPSNLVYCSAVNPFDNTVWFGTQDGFALYNDLIGDWTSFGIPPSFNFRINAMAFDGAGTVWLGKLVGVTSFNRESGEWAHYTNENTGGRLPGGSINAVATDLGSTRWFGTDAGLVRLRDTTWTTFTTANTPELPGNAVTALAFDRMGNLWIGTKTGLAVFNEAGTRF